MSGGWAVYWTFFCVFAFLFLGALKAPVTPLRGKMATCDKCRDEHRVSAHARDALNIMGLVPAVALMMALVWPGSLMMMLKGLPHYISGHRL